MRAALGRCAIARKLMKTVRANVTIDWAMPENVLFKRILREQAKSVVCHLDLTLGLAAGLRP